MTETNSLSDARHAAARAFVGQELKKRRAWSSFPYAYDYQEDGMTFLHWYEDSPKKGTAQRFAEACGAYEARFGREANLILVNEADAAAQRPGCEVRVEKRVGPNNYQVAHQD